MAGLNFETGLVTYKINDAVEVVFNPTDLEFAKRLFAAFDALDAKQGEFERFKADAVDAKALFEFTSKLDVEMREALDETFNAPVCEALFGNMSCFAFADGLPVWCNLVLAVMDEMKVSFADEQKKTNPRLKKYLDKYSAK